MTREISRQTDLIALSQQIKQWGQDYGFQQVGISDCDLGSHVDYFKEWLNEKLYADMKWIKDRETLRLNPDQLHPNTIRVISFRMNYLEPNTQPQHILKHKDKAYISRYALGRDYHKLIRKRLQNVAKKIEHAIGDFSYRVFTDSAPILEKAFAEKSGLGWIGKHTLLLNRQAGSWFFLGEIYTDIPLPLDEPVRKHCGSCSACIDICPTQAIIAPYKLDAAKCISYLTIENKNAIPTEYRKAIGNRVFGCDDCQLVCPWNKYAQATAEDDFQPRHKLDNSKLLTLFAWDEKTFLKNTEGSAIRRTGYQGWLRNLAIALGNAPYNEQVITALEHKRINANAMVAEHIDWAITQQHEKSQLV